MNDEKHILLFAHGGSRNHGCEALVRTTTAILRRSLGPCRFAVASRAPQDDRAILGEGEDLRLLRHGHAVGTLHWYGYAAAARLLGRRDFLYALQYHEVIAQARRSDVCVSIGGDNYCYPNHGYLYTIDRHIHSADKPLALWGCSIEGKLLGPAMAEDLRRFAVITARESLSMAALHDAGVGQRAFLHPDPAFTLQREDLPLPKEWREGNTVGLNLSPMVLRHEHASGVMMAAAAALVRHILDTTDGAVALIPHVTSPHSNDLVPLTELYRAFASTGRVALLDASLNAKQLKGYIARCRLFVGARTHATIAAYSCAVPTLALGYSVKARGIARDLFGSEEGLVLPVQALQGEQQLISAFEGLREREEELRAHLTNILPGIVENAWAGGNRLARLVTTSGCYSPMQPGL